MGDSGESPAAPRVAQSAIRGAGHGDQHLWRRIRTAVVRDGNHSAKQTVYVCAKCSATFIHKYDLIPDIFEAMEQSGVPGSCA